jgi:foldase protein PrsA
MRRFIANGLGALAMLICLDQSIVGQESRSDVVAVVAGAQLTAGEVDGFLKRVLDDRPLDPPVRRLLQAKALEQLVGQLLVNEYLRSNGRLASDDELNTRIAQLASELGSVEQTMEQYLAEQGMTAEGLAHQLRFQLSWPKYLDQMLTDENLKRHFERYQRELDGSEIHVNHLLLKPTESMPDSESVRQAADSIRQQLVSGELRWADAVEQHSQAATRESAGDLGWIGRFAPMPESFSAAAFKLEPEEISQPVRTEFGWHLIRCEQWRSGTKKYEEILPDVRRHATHFLFQWVVDKQRVTTPPEYPGAYPRMDAETGELIESEKETTKPGG